MFANPVSNKRNFVMPKRIIRDAPPETAEPVAEPIAEPVAEPVVEAAALPPRKRFRVDLPRRVQPEVSAQVELAKEVEVPVEKAAVKSSAATKKTAKPKNKPHGRDLPDSMKVAGEARYYSVKDRVWAMLHECVDRAEMKAIAKDYAYATDSGNDVLILGCAIHPECTHFFRTRDLKNDYYSIEESGVHTSDKGVIKRVYTDWKPIAGCEELSIVECNDRLKGHTYKNCGGTPKGSFRVFECHEHADCDHRMQRRKYKGSSTFALLEDGAHPDGSTGSAGRIASQSSAVEIGAIGVGCSADTSSVCTAPYA